MARRGFGGLRLGMLAALAVPLAACVQVQPAAYYDPYAYAPPAGSNTAAGAVTGAAAGGLLGGLASGRHDRGLGIVGGAAAGALIGGLIGNQMDQQNAAAAQGYGYAQPYPPPVAYPAPGYPY
ncbi:MAG: glycine zipper 2TM domain-containing protein [Acetobacteraceae bacterium]|nr:glycine zipper 2TM domain-containing protein [Acetobacteraceae bacterium]